MMILVTQRRMEARLGGRLQVALVTMSLGTLDRFNRESLDPIFSSSPGPPW